MQKVQIFVNFSNFFNFYDFLHFYKKTKLGFAQNHPTTLKPLFVLKQKD
jgi:hypothetical protein